MLRELGSGNFGQVWVALLRPEARSLEEVTSAAGQPMLGVAVKTCRPNSEEAARNLRTEIQVRF